MRTFVNALLVLLAGAFVLALLAVVAASPAPLILNPAIGCLALAGAFILGVARKVWWLAMVLALGATMLNLALLFTLAPGWRLAGIFEPGFIVWASYLLAAFGLISGAGWGLGRGISLLARSLSNRSGPIRGDAKP
jgi:hypothetical protein